MDFLYNIDLSIFYFINKSLSNYFLDGFFPLITTEKNWFLLYIMLFYILLLNNGKKGRIAFVVLILTFAVTDILNSMILKELFGRIRPCHVLSDINILIPCGAGKSFPSSHAVNTFGAAFILSAFYNKYKVHLFTIAGLVALSRVYVGVHYPSDILAGTGLGILVAFLIIQFYKYLDRKYFKVLIKQNSLI